MLEIRHWKSEIFKLRKIIKPISKFNLKYEFENIQSNHAGGRAGGRTEVVLGVQEGGHQQQAMALAQARSVDNIMSDAQNVDQQ